MIKSEAEITEIFAELEDLFKTDPDQFEDLRQEIIDTAINSYPEKYRQRARGIQFALDCELNKQKNPVMRMNRMVELFWDKVYEFQDAISDPIQYSEKKEMHKKAGKVVSLCRPWG